MSKTMSETRSAFGVRQVGRSIRLSCDHSAEVTVVKY